MMSQADGPAGSPGPRATRQAYSIGAGFYEARTRGFAPYRRRVVERLPLRRGDAVLDVGCGTGLCFPLLLDRVGPEGTVVGVDASRPMLDLAAERTAANGWRNVHLVHAEVDRAPLPVVDHALFCAVHDILQRPAALDQVLSSVRPGGGVAAIGGKWAPGLGGAGEPRCAYGARPVRGQLHGVPAPLGASRRAHPGARGDLRRPRGRLSRVGLRAGRSLAERPSAGRELPRLLAGHHDDGAVSVQKAVDLTGSGETIQDAVTEALDRARLTLEGITAFEVQGIAGTVDGSGTAYRVQVRIWFTLLERMHG